MKVRKNRTHLEISRDMLELSRDGVGKTELMYGANLSWELLQKYVGRLVGKGMLSSDAAPRNRTRYRTTEKGLIFLQECRRMDRLGMLRSEYEERVKRAMAEVDEAMKEAGEGTDLAVQGIKT